MRNRILVLDDEQDKLILLRDFLGREFFEVATAQDGMEALARLEQFDPDLILLDVHMPHMDGLEACRQIRQRPGYAFGGSKRILMFSDKRVDLVDRVSGLDLGADRYLVRPVAPRELLAEIHALLRSIPESSTPITPPTIARKGVLVIHKGQLEILLDDRMILVRGQKRPLATLPFKLLLSLAERIDQAVSKDEIIDRVWGYPESDEVLTTAIKRLRSEIEQDPSKPIYLQTVRGYGYKLVRINDHV
jgi:DNA-binding response OmpR family regulator